MGHKTPQKAHLNTKSNNTTGTEQTPMNTQKGLKPKDRKINFKEKFHEIINRNDAKKVSELQDYFQLITEQNRIKSNKKSSKHIKSVNYFT